MDKRENYKHITIIIISHAAVASLSVVGGLFPPHHTTTGRLLLLSFGSSYRSLSSVCTTTRLFFFVHSRNLRELEAQHQDEDQHYEEDGAGDHELVLCKSREGNGGWRCGVNTRREGVCGGRLSFYLFFLLPTRVFCHHISFFRAVAFCGRVRHSSTDGGKRGNQSVSQSVHARKKDSQP